MGDLNFTIEGPRHWAQQTNNVHNEQATKAPGGTASRVPFSGGEATAPVHPMDGHAGRRPPMPSNGYDVFLSYNSRDQQGVKQIARDLRERGITSWLDQWELRPGVPWQPVIEAMIKGGKAAAVFIGPSGLGPWQDVEQQAFLQEFDRRGCAVIPVILPDCFGQPDIPAFLNRMTRVDFRKPVPDPMELLIWGITGDRRGRRTDGFAVAEGRSSDPPGGRPGGWLPRLFSGWRNRHHGSSA